MERPWTSFYGPSVRTQIDELPYRNLGDLVSHTASVHGDAPAFTVCLPNGMNGTLSFRQVDEMSTGLAAYLREVAGLEAGDRVALQAPNGLPFPVVAFGVFKAGCVLVNVNPLYTAEEMARQFADSKPAALVIVDMFADKLPEALKGHHIPTVIVTRVAEFMPALPKMIVGAVQKYWDKTIHPVDVAHIRLPDAIAAGAARRDAGKIGAGSYTAPVEPDDIACLQYTGGTTGVSKGAMLSHRNIIMNMAQTMEMISGVQKGEEVALTALPMYHIFAFTVNLIGFYWLGARNILIPNPRPLSNLKRAFENYKITWMSGVNTLFNGLSSEIWFLDTPPKHLKFASAGGMALQKAVAERWEAITGKPVLEGYGLTESSPVITFNPLGRTRSNSIGVPVPSTDVACLDSNGKPVAPGEAGELAARGAAGDAGLLEPSRGNRKDHQGRLAADRRHRRHGCGRLFPDCRPQEGHGAGLGLQRLPQRDRGLPCRPSGHCRIRRDRGSRRGVRRGGEGLCRPPRCGSERRGCEGLLQAASDGLQGAKAGRIPR
jgi:long-chain acyl-CoA synthetase